MKIRELFRPQRRPEALNGPVGGGYAIWQQILGEWSGSSSGMMVTPDSALRVAAVLSCVRVLAETVAQLPWHPYERMADGSKRYAPEHPLSNVLRRPNAWQTSFEFREMMMGHCALRGNAFARIVPGVFGSVTELIPWHPDRVRVDVNENGTLIYIRTNPRTLEEERYTQDEVFHLRWFSSDGIVGISPISLACNAIGLAMAEETYAAAFFKNGARPGVILRHPTKLDEPAARRLREDWERLHGSANNAHRTAVLEGGMDVHELGMTNQDSQFVESRNLQVEDICRIFRIPQHLVNKLDRSTFSNIEHQSLDFVKHTMTPWLRRWEEAISRDLIADDDRYYVKFNVEGLLRGDSAARSAFLREMVNSGIYTLNEAREFEDLPPIEGGDVPLVQGAMVPLDRILNPPEPPPALVAPQTTDEPDDDEDEEEDESMSVAVTALADTARTMTAAVARLAESKDSGGEELARQVGELQSQRESIERTLAETEQRLAAELEQTRSERDSIDAERAAAVRDLEAEREQREQAAAQLEGVLQESRIAALAVATDEAARLLRWEGEKLSRAAKKGDGFLKTAEKFYGEHRGRMRNGLAASVSLLRSLGVMANPEEIDEYMNEREAALVQACVSHEPEDLLSVVSTMTGNCEERATALIERMTHADAAC